MRRMRIAGLVLAAALLGGTSDAAPPVPYDVVYVRQPRYGDDTATIWPEVFHPARIDPGADLVLLHPDGREEVLVAAGNGAVTDPFVSFDARWVYYAYFPDVRYPQGYNTQRDLPWAGADVYKIHLPTRQVVRLTHDEFTPNTGAGHFDESNPVDPGPEFDKLGYGILNLDWRWQAAADVALQDLGDPAKGGTDYRLCVYDVAGTSAMSMRIPAGGRCGRGPCWRKQRRAGFHYRDGAGRAQGLTEVSLRSGPVRNARIAVRGRGRALPMPAAGPALPAIVQLVRGDGAGACWGGSVDVVQGGRRHR